VSGGWGGDWDAEGFDCIAGEEERPITLFLKYHYFVIDKD
jgi:hypothetical protein